jgi:hypothetical protein
MSRTTRISTGLTVPGSFGLDIGQLADVMCRRVRDRSSNAMDVVSNGGGPRLSLHRRGDPEADRMKRTRIARRRVRSERPRLEALSPDPRDPDIVRAKAIARTASSKEAPGK